MLTRARAAYADVSARHPGFDRAHVGNLVLNWRSGPGTVGEWGVFDSHDRQKVYASHLEYVHPLKTGDLVFVFDADWTPVRAGELKFVERLFQTREGWGISHLMRTATFDGTDELARLWSRDVNAIALTRPDAAEWTRWRTRQQPDFERWRAYRDRVREVRARDFTYPLAHFESAVDGAPDWTLHDDGLAVGVRRAGEVHPIARGDYLLFFDGEDRVIERHKFLEFERLTFLNHFDSLASAIDVLARTRRLVIVRGHFFLNEKF